MLLHGADRSVTGKSGVWVDTGSGMVILGKGDGLPASLKMLEDLSENGRLAGDMQCLLRRLGQAASLSFQARRATARLQPIETRLKAADTRAKELNAELSTLRLAYDARAAKLARSQLDLFAKEKEVSSFALKLEQTEPQLLRHQEAAERERKTRFDETAALTKMLEAKLEQISALEGSLKARDERETTQGKQLSSLQQRIEELKRQIQDMEAKPDRISALEESLKARDELAKTQAEQLKSQQQRVEQLKRQIKDMETSKSWRITAPIRAFRRGLKV
ncbi:hypothetical protein [Paracoccus sediminicola]|uniref:hypothetical protein n=1 Tax=Paracoccus sediminicola TaxID=3017783 RepID=UPI0022F010E5|nr:hypothetical protein [Paracoccus sediminicola]WBU55517.1 hypothetical protein PAF18_08225 [Paracoccus sediminicola]